VGADDGAAVKAAEVGSPVHKIAVGIAPPAVDAKTLTTKSALAHSRRQRGQLQKVAAIERQRQDLLSVNHVPKGGVLGLQQGSRAPYLHHFGDGAYLQRHVQAELRIHPQDDIPEAGPLKTRSFD